MLYTNTIHERTLALLKELMKVAELKKFSLVGGTALSLEFGHRISDDIDLFIEEDFDKQEIIIALREKFGKIFFMKKEETLLVYFVL